MQGHINQDSTTEKCQLNIVKILICNYENLYIVNIKLTIHYKTSILHANLHFHKIYHRYVRAIMIILQAKFCMNNFEEKMLILMIKTYNFIRR